MRKILPGILLVVLAVFVAEHFFPQIRMKRITVLTIPDGAMVSINGVPAGFSPFTQFVPRDGVYVSAEKDGFFPADSLAETSPDTLFLQLKEGCLLVVNSRPAGCQILSHNFSGIAPCSLIVESGSSVELTALGEMGVSVTRTVNLLTPGARVVTITVPFEFTDRTIGVDFTVIPEDMLPFAMGPLTVGRYEVTASQFAEFMNSVDPELRRDSFSVIGRTCLMDSILKCNWRIPVALCADSTCYQPVPGMENYPMAGMTWDGAVWYCEWLTAGSTTGLEFRLPESTEWGILASAGSELPVNLSDVNEIILTRHPDIDDGWRETAPAGAMGRSSWGLCEMQGNLWEWTDFRGVAAGGSWLSSVEDCASESRIDLSANLGYPFVGLRVVATGVPQDISAGSFISEQEADRE
ncbi:MAG: SUMF1/EgtB/PvdO family nonheme iron enzyme [Candidatus Fermentibacteraceae bacterium]|nr:SUMF1/EgtB/PvdO family nonheme iron enzyme [Candidatus Fermentibacteraceae bacterium]